MNQSERLAAFLQEGLARQDQWQSRWPTWQPDESLLLSDATVREILERLILRLEENYPFWHPDYAGQMIKPPHEIALLGYFLTQRINPNNHALDGGPATAQMEKEVVAALADLFGYPQSLGHLTSSGTIANLEALWVARELAPGKAIACSREAHYTHRRMGQVLGVETIQIATGADGRMDLDDLRAKLREGRIGTVVMTAGTTATGAVDPIDEAIELQRESPFRMHVDAAYGGFFRLLAGPDGPLPGRTAAALRAIEASDSVVVDPHKHGLQPYGCGSVLFRDPSVGRFYQHDSPYTYFTWGRSAWSVLGLGLPPPPSGRPCRRSRCTPRERTEPRGPARGSERCCDERARPRSTGRPGSRRKIGCGSSPLPNSTW